MDSNGHIRGVEIIDAPTDADLAQEAERLKEKLGDPGYEVWDCGRPVLSNTVGCTTPAARR
ncbi:hypothetical protein DJ018_09120 [Phenylobacterium deserti]|uniref:Uncharacterized protein n=1 Tax=Phenylobacterium deserti TaxID=1914756 RepID=A0A328AV63_9CAUL|nr:hypothetical protein DJ018_09120 [Phenylobacterium deserti]